MQNLKGQSFLRLEDYDAETIRFLLDESKRFKQMKKDGVAHRYQEGKNIVLLFEKTSTRTRCAFEVAGFDLGMGVTFLDAQSSQMGKKESIEDTARVLGRMYDGIEYRGFDQVLVEELAEKSGVPVWNGLTNESHPTQMLADLLTVEENMGRLKGVNLTFMGDGRNNVANSLLTACALMGVNYTLCGPKELYPAQELIDKAYALAEKSGSTISFTEDVEEGTKGADVIYTDIWLSMGEPNEVWAERVRLLQDYRVTEECFENAADHAIFMHCLPSFHDLQTEVGQEIYKRFGVKEMEVEDAVFESEASVVFDQAENRMHTIKAIMNATL